jgi:sulfonate transport system ATP-binding protein
MQKALRFNLPDAGTDEGADYVEEARLFWQGSEHPGRGLALTIRGLRKSFGDHDVLRGIDLHIPAGQFVAIVGRSGCGKSTLLRLIAGLDHPDAGSISFGTEVRPTDMRMMFQEPRLLPWARVLSNVEVGLGRDRSSPDAQARAESALDQVGLAEKRGEWPAVLSGGQKQRVALARALVSRPRLLAFDEPLGALDALTRISMQQLLEGVWRDQGFTAILVTHDVTEAVALADRVLLIEEGRIAQDIHVNLGRPRQRGSADLAALEGSILRELLRSREGASSHGQTNDALSTIPAEPDVRPTKR